MLRLAVFALLVAAASASVEGIIGCGSEGTVLDVRVTDCVSIPCTLVKGQTYNVEVDFRPAAEHTELTVLVFVTYYGQEFEIVHESVPAVVSPGNAYTLAYPWTVTGDFIGFVSLRIELTGNGVKEVCGLATADVLEGFIF